MTTPAVQPVQRDLAYALAEQLLRMLKQETTVTAYSVRDGWMQEETATFKLDEHTTLTIWLTKKR